MALFVVGAVTVAGIGFMIDIALRKNVCPQCEHCKEAARLAQLRKEAKRLDEWVSLHRRGHRMDFGDINGQCPVCKESGRVPPPSGPTKDDDADS